MKFIFLDRDGVINRYPGDTKYVTCLRDFRFLPGTLQAIELLTNKGFRIFVVSNQAGVTKGLYSKETLDRMTKRMLKEVKRSGGAIEKVLYCLHTDAMNCSCRKPKDGLLKQATAGHCVDKIHSYFIGDSLLDVKAGKLFGCKTILVLSGREKLKNARNWDALPDFIAKNLLDAARHIVGNKYKRA